ncbi:uncharacterized protein [Argopecten irradians]|uniref:uncharacterized protein n=1 Tax=Argopecten irradians TaxID=31199 RepID=UPI0037192BA2
MRIAALNMAFTLSDSFSLETFRKQDIFNTTSTYVGVITKSIIKKMRENPQELGLEHLGMLDPESSAFNFSDGFVCPGHSVCWKADEKITNVTPDWFKGYSKFITTFNLGDNQLTFLPPEVFQELSQLRVLDLHSNYLEALPDTISCCKNLEELILRGNNLLDLPATLDGCQALKSLDISSNRIDELPGVITRLYSLTHLVAQELLLTVLPDNIGNLSKLTVLNLNENCLTGLPESFSMLQNLKELYLAGIAWLPNKANNFLSKDNFKKALGPVVTRWLEGSQDKSMSLDDMFNNFDVDGQGTLNTTNIARANAILFNTFPRFGYTGKTLPDDKTPSGFPEEILALKNLSTLDLQYQGLVHIPKDIQDLQNLTTLQLGSNPYLLSVAAEAGRCPLQHLNLSECPLLKTPPKEIRERGFTTTVAYLKRLLTGSVDCKRTKLMLVGLGGAGKTSLVRALMSSLQQKSTLTGADAITDGIDICTWDVNHKGETVSYSVWDFAGQTIYYNTHQFFLSDRAVYLLLWNIRLGHEHAGLNFWLNSITVHAPKAPIFVVGTHTDQMTKISLPMEDLKEKYHQIMDFHFVSSKNGNGIPELKEALFDVTLQQEYMGEKIPQAWLQLESNITRQRAEKSVNVMQYKDVEAEALNVGIIDKTEVVQAVQFLHDLGMVQHFQNEYLKDRVVINPQWIVDVMACVVSVKQTVVKDGRLMHSDINEVWKEYVDMADWLLKVTEEFDLTYPLEGENCNIVPCLLPETQPDFEWPDVVKRKKEKKSRQKILETKLVYTFDYLPAGLFNRGQVRLYGISDPDILIWKTGIFLKKNGQIALVQQIGYSELNVKVQGPQPDNLLFLIYEVFECLIKESFQGVTYDCEIPCPDCVKQDSVYPHMFPASVVRRAVEVKAPFIQCHKNFHSSPVLNLQGVLAPDDNADYDIHLSQDVNSLHQMQEAMTVDIFISYCSKDAPKNKSSVIHPATVCADLEQEGYTCFLPKDEQLDSREEMAKKLVHSSVILVFASNNYAANDICCDMYKYAINTLKKPAIVVAVGEDFGWKQSASLGVFMTDVVFVNMINSKKDVYKVKFAELLSTLQKNEQLSQTRMETSNSCFISYAWANSETAVALGTKALPGSVGKSDPREFKTFLESRGIGCWLDIEQVNVNDQLFARIAKGLCESRVMVACVSDEYANSRNCIREIKFAIQINLPIIIAVVGTGVRWLKTEVGLLTTDFPKVNFQHNPDKETLQTLYQLILDNMKPETEEDTDTKENKEEMEENNQISFQEMYELAQRKLLRQVSSYPSTYDIGNYPRLFVMDIAETVSEDEVKLVNYQVHTLCECDQGWHSVSDPIVMETKKVDADMVAEVLDEFTPYLYRINTVMEHNTGFVLNLFAIGTGQQCNQQIKELAMVSPLSVPASYHRLRVQIHELDTKKTKGNLKRCRLSSGRIIWLCEEHAVQMKVTVLSEEAGEVKHIITNQPWLDTMTEYIKNMRSTKYRPYVFKSNSKTKRYIEDFIEDDTDIKRALKKTVLRRQSSIKILDVTADMSETKPQDHVSTEEATSIESKKKKKKKKHKETPEEEEQVSEGLSSQTDPGVKLADPELKHTEPEFKHADPEVKQAESEVKQADSEVKQADLEVKQPDPEVKQDDFEVKRSTISLKGRTTSANSQPGNRSAPPGPDDGNSAWPSQSRVQENKGEDDRKTQAGAKSKACVLL